MWAENTALAIELSSCLTMNGRVCAALLASVSYDILCLPDGEGKVASWGRNIPALGFSNLSRAQKNNNYGQKLAKYLTLYKLLCVIKPLFSVT